MIVWGLSGMVALVAGILWTFVTGGGFGVALIGLKVFPIVILGGLDSIAGTIIAAIAVGVLVSARGTSTRRWDAASAASPRIWRCWRCSCCGRMACWASRGSSGYRTIGDSSL
jgi:branched-subunit amino acid ABC-type transport system permease component